MLNKKELTSIFENIAKKKALKVTRTRLGHSSVTYKINTDDKNTYYFKQGKNNYKLQYEISELLRSKGITTPEILSFDNEWIIEKGIIGNRLDIRSKGLSKHILFQFGKTLSKLHSIKTVGYGELASIEVGVHKRYTEYYSKIINLIHDKYKKEIVEYINKDHATYLNHGDICPNHIYVNSQGEYVAIIDWDDVVSAPIEFDLSELMLNINNSEECWNSFMDGYSITGQYIHSHNRDLLLAELLQATEGLYYQLIETKDDNDIDRTKRTKIKMIEKMIDNT